ncbi:hypothetical protein K438DRAFT_1765360 [Mycena galopus ATCC 62051]|nr:hypothetical protein K438DRAFT_1765360 [Mycena galopus ATCC 62051]
MSGFQEFRHVRFRSGSTWFNDLSRCDKPLCLPPPSSAARDADTPPQHLSTVQPRVGAPEAARPPLSLGKHEMPKATGNLLGLCSSVQLPRANQQEPLLVRGSVGRAARNYATRGGDPITTRIASSACVGFTKCVAVSGLREPRICSAA